MRGLAARLHFLAPALAPALVTLPVVSFFSTCTRSMPACEQGADGSKLQLPGRLVVGAAHSAHSRCLLA